MIETYRPIVRESLHQTVTFSDDSTLELPFELTISQDADQWSLKLDITKRVLNLGSRVERPRLVTTANILLVDHWRHEGRVGTPKRVD